MFARCTSTKVGTSNALLAQVRHAARAASRRYFKAEPTASLKYVCVCVLVQGLQTLLRSFVTANRITIPGRIEEGLSSAIFTVTNDIGSLSHVLGAFERHGVSLSYIESRPNKGSYVLAVLLHRRLSTLMLYLHNWWQQHGVTHTRAPGCPHGHLYR